MTARDGAELEAWWRGFVADGRLPEALQLVQGRLIRSVHKGSLGKSEVFVKTMSFPRAKDRLRYLLRALPAAHEAAMLRSAATAGVRCPEVLAAFGERRLGLPRRSMLVLRALPVVAEPAAPERRVADEVALAMHLLRAGIEHRDLHSENFVRTAGGELAVLDLQSARQRPPSEPSAPVRLAVAARMLRERDGEVSRSAVDAMRACGMLATESEVSAALARRDAEAARYRRSRVLRCLQTSTEFERSVSWSGVRYAHRVRTPDGRWIRGGRELREAWLGQRVRQLEDGSPPRFGAFFRKWWWLGGGRALYVPSTWSDEQIDAELAATSAFCRPSPPRRAGQL